MKKLQLYFDTSVFNFAFADDAPDEKGITLILLEQLRQDRYSIFISDVVIREVSNAPKQKAYQLTELINELSPAILDITDDCIELAQRYIQEGIIPVKHKDDALHIAIASVHNMDGIISWNFKHIVKLKTRREVKAINLLLGYKEVDIISPQEVIYND
ncbi:MAG: type II toxin-antitoxin system VapC family toxin [Candidatus Schekmanbacteria bacterium]|nr:type II toxin-antitoxin system VapC family toxin [Candidatus Schekmanbacteria bacterium]